jgi:hypothetical protein
VYSDPTGSELVGSESVDSAPGEPNERDC